MGSIEKSGRKLKSFQIQLFSLFVVILPVLCGLVVYDLVRELSDMRRNYSIQQDQIERRITESIRILDTGQKFVEKTIEDEMENDFKAFIEAYDAAAGNAADIDLDGVREIIGANKDLYIINRKGIIEFSTRKEDLGVDFNKWGMGRYIEKIRKGNKFYSSRIDPAFVSGVIRKYAYYPSPDHKYVLEIGIDVEKYGPDPRNQIMGEITARMKVSNPNVLSIRLFNRDGVQLGSHLKKTDKQIITLIRKVFKTKKTVTRIDGDATKKYIFVDLNSPDYATDPSMVVEIISTDKYYLQAIREIWFFHLISLTIFMLIGLCAIYFISYRVSTPIRQLANHVQNIPEGGMPERLGLDSSYELRLLEDAIHEMANRIRERTQELSEQNKKLLEEIDARERSEKDRDKLQKQLFQSQKMEVVGQLAGGIAHDFNNMLAIILGSAQLVRDVVSDDSDILEDIDAIIDASKRSRDLVSKLLLFSRKDTATLEDVAVKDIVAAVTGMLKRTLNKNIEIRETIEKDYILKCDANQIHQALLNICNNAADAMPGGGILTIECSREHFSHTTCETCGEELLESYCLLQVSDTGVGMSREMTQKVVEPFFTTKGIGKGTGLGLSVTHGIVKGHNGHMHIYSEINKGTCIKLYLPISDMDCINKPHQDSVKMLSGTETILVVDDEGSLLAMAGKMLKKMGYTPILCNSGCEAIEVFTENAEKISLIILDIMMPDMDGPELFGRIRELNKNIKVIFSSGYSINGQAKQLFEHGKHIFVQKPFSIEELSRAIRDLLDTD